MTNTITIKGIGSVKSAVDYVVLSISLATIDKDYEKAMDLATNRIDELNKSLEKVGFDKKSIKTTNFNVRSNYDYKNNKRVFNGYVVAHDLKLSFDFNTETLSKALSALSACVAKPEVSIRFTVKDTSKVNEELLRSATLNARKKAEILSLAANKKLGELLSIEYNWNDINLYSRTLYENECVLSSPLRMSKEIDIEPEDVETNDSATFIWELI